MTKIPHQGFEYRYQGQTWWIAGYPERPANPVGLARFLGRWSPEGDGPYAPAELARILGARFFAPFDRQIRSRVERAGWVPDPFQVSLPPQLPQDWRQKVEPAILWAEMLYGAGQSVAESLLQAVFPYVRGKRFIEERLRVLKELPVLPEAFRSASVLRRTRAFLRWLAFQGEPTSEMLMAARSSLEELARVAVNTLHPPSTEGLEPRIALSLVLPTAVVRRHPFEVHYADNLIAAAKDCKELNPRLWQKLLDETPQNPDRIHSILQFRGNPEELDRHGLALAALPLEKRERRTYLKWKALLQQLGLDRHALLANYNLVKRPAFLVYKLLEQRATLPGQEALDAFDTRVPGLKLSELAAQVRGQPAEDFSELARRLEVEPSKLNRVVHQRRYLGLPPLPATIEKWASDRQDREISALEERLQSERSPAKTNAMARRLQKLKDPKNQRVCSSKEKRRAQKALEGESLRCAKQSEEKLKENALLHLAETLLGPLSENRRPLTLLCDRPDLEPLLRQVLYSSAEQLAALPKNAAWLGRARRCGVDTVHWLAGKEREIEVDGRCYTLVLERDSAEILRMGDHFNTCLSLHGCCAEATLVNCLEVNKQVLYARTPQGKVVARKLLAANLHGRLLGYQTYSHGPRLEEPMRQFCLEFARECNLVPADDGRVEELFGLDWYDDGARPWTERSQAQLTDWPSDARPCQAHAAFMEMHAGHPPTAQSWAIGQAIVMMAALGRFENLRERRDEGLCPATLLSQLPYCPKAYGDALNILAKMGVFRVRLEHLPAGLVLLALEPLAACLEQVLEFCQFHDPRVQEEAAELLQIAYLRSSEPRPLVSRLRGVLQPAIVRVGCREQVRGLAGPLRRLFRESGCERVALALGTQGRRCDLPMLRQAHRRRPHSVELALALKRCGGQPDWRPPEELEGLRECGWLRELDAPRLRKRLRRQLARGGVHERLHAVLGGHLVGFPDEAMQGRLLRAALQGCAEATEGWFRLAPNLLRAELIALLNLKVTAATRTRALDVLATHAVASELGPRLWWLGGLGPAQQATEASRWLFTDISAGVALMVHLEKLKKWLPKWTARQALNLLSLGWQRCLPEHRRQAACSFSCVEMEREHRAAFLAGSFPVPLRLKVIGETPLAELLPLHHRCKHESQTWAAEQVAWQMVRRLASPWPLQLKRGTEVTGCEGAKPHS